MNTRTGSTGIGAALAAAVVAGALLAQSCAHPAANARLATAPADGAAKRSELTREQRTAVEAQIGAIARDYASYPRVSAKLQWSPAMCREPDVPSVKLTAAPDDSPHGRKLYFLYAKDGPAYHDMSWHGLDKSTFERVARPQPMTNPVGQAVVKEAFVPVSADAERPRYNELRKAFQHNPPSIALETRPLERYAQDDHGKLVRAGELSALFIMLKLDPATPGTDQGWVYATVAPDRTTITSMGVIESCMNCHKQTDRDRLYGDKNFWPESWPGATVKPEAKAAAPQPTR